MLIEKVNVTGAIYSSVEASTYLSWSINWGSGKSFASVRYALQSTEQLKSKSLWRAHPGTKQLKQHGQMYLPSEQHLTDTGNTSL